MSFGILEKRRAQAEVIKPIYDELVARLGKESATEIIDSAIRRAAVEEGKRMAGDHPTDLQSFADLLPLWTQDDALTIETLQQTETQFDYNVTRCRYAEMYQEMGLGEIGHLLSCNRDACFCEGYDPLIRLTRTQTIMQGACHCDFRFRR